MSNTCSNDRFICLGGNCPNHCCKDYEGFADKLIPLNGITFSEIILTDEDVERLKAINREDLIIQNSHGICKIRTHEGGICYALMNGKCEVYDARPSICRAYPFYLDFFAGLCALRECPAFSSDITPETDMKNAVMSLIDVYQYWINLWKKRLSEIQ